MCVCVLLFFYSSDIYTFANHQANDDDHVICPAQLIQLANNFPLLSPNWVAKYNRTVPTNPMHWYNQRYSKLKINAFCPLIIN